MESLNQSSSSSSETQESLFMFMRFNEGKSLYALYHFIINTTYTKHQKPLLHPKVILRFDREKFPIGMGCINLNSKVYFIGGQFERDGEIYNSKTVYVLHLDTIKSCLNDGKNKLELIEGPKMHSGKSNPLVVEAAGKIYVLALLFYPDANKSDYKDDFYTRMHKVTEEAKSNYEVFDSKSGQWTVLPNHPFSHENFILGHVVVGNIIYFFAEREYCFDEQRNCIYCFDMQKQKWVSNQELNHYNFSLHNTFSSRDCYFRGIGIVVNDTIYVHGNGGKGAITTYHLSKNMEENSVFSDAVRGLEFSTSLKVEYYYGNGPLFVEGYLVHLGDEKFCLVSYEDRFEHSRRQDKKQGKAKRDVNFTTFQVIKQKSHGENFLWADIVDSYAIEIDADLCRLCYCFTA